MSRPTVDQMKMDRDGQLSYGDGSIPVRSFWPKRTSVGYAADGEIVAECRSFGRKFGEIAYGNVDQVVRWEQTQEGVAVFGTRDPDTPTDEAES